MRGGRHRTEFRKGFSVFVSLKLGGYLELIFEILLISCWGMKMKKMKTPASKANTCQGVQYMANGRADCS